MVCVPKHALLVRFNRPPTLVLARLAGGWVALPLGALSVSPAAIHKDAAAGALVLAGLRAGIGAWILSWLPAVHLYAWLTPVWTFAAFLLLMLWAPLASGIEALFRSWISGVLRAVPGRHDLGAVNNIASPVIARFGARFVLRQLAQFGLSYSSACARGS